MKRTVFALAVLLSAALTLLPHAHSQNPVVGPGDKGAVLRQPWLETGTGPAPTAPAAPRSGSGTPTYLQGLLQSTGADRASPANNVAGSLMPYDTIAINNDILVQPEMGPWMVLITSYRGKDGPMRARKMVSVLRSVYKLPAYVFNFGTEAKRKELERVSKIVQNIREGAKQENLSLDQPIRISHVRIDEYVGVLVGGYPTMEAARKARDGFRTLKADPRMFTLVQVGDLLDSKFYTSDPSGKPTANQEAVFVSPFDRAFPVHNPSIKVERPAEANKLDVAALRHLNSAEDLSLFNCKKNYTLVIKQFNTPTVTGLRHEQPPASGFWDSFGFGKKAERVDGAAENCASARRGAAQEPAGSLCPAHEVL